MQPENRIRAFMHERWSMLTLPRPYFFCDMRWVVSDLSLQHTDNLQAAKEVEFQTSWGEFLNEENV